MNLPCTIAHNAPLYPRPNDNELDKEFTVEYAVNYWLQSGADPKKLVYFSVHVDFE